MGLQLRLMINLSSDLCVRTIPVNIGQGEKQRASQLRGTLAPASVIAIEGGSARQKTFTLTKSRHLGQLNVGDPLLMAGFLTNRFLMKCDLFCGLESGRSRFADP